MCWETVEQHSFVIWWNQQLMSKVLCSQVLWAQGFNLLWFNGVYCEGERVRKTGSWAERLRWVGRGKARGNRLSDATRATAAHFPWWEGFQRAIPHIRNGWWAAKPTPAFSLLQAHFPPSFPINDVLILLVLCILCQVLCVTLFLESMVTSVLEMVVGTLHPDAQASVCLYAECLVWVLVLRGVDL